MRKLRVGVWLNSNMIPGVGGGYGYYSELVKAMSKYSFKDAEIIFLSNKLVKDDTFKSRIIKSKPQKLIILKILLKIIIRLHPLFKSLRKIIEKIINKSKHEIYQYADIIYYLTPDCVYPDSPYIYTLWDLGHFNCYAFPELSMNGIFEIRKKHHDFIPHKALMVFTESETGKKQCEKYLNINKDRIEVVPVFPSGVVDQKCIAVKPAKMKKGDCFIHYPAQFWAHKNHYNLLVAMLSVIETFSQIKLVLTGADKGNKKYILETIVELELEKNVIDLGFVSLEELRWLYENSHGLVMPTLLGPTNMPVIEAAELNCPVACTNLSGHIEQLGDYGYYFNGIDPNDIAKHILLMINDKKSGIIKRYDSKFNMNNAMEAIDESFSKLKQIIFCWGKNDRIS